MKSFYCDRKYIFASVFTACLTLKQLETYRCILSTVNTDALMLKYQAISIYSDKYIFIVWDQSHTETLYR